MAAPLLSSTVLLCAPSLRRATFEYSFFFVKRHSKSRFMPDTFVFPGGVMESVDHMKSYWDLSTVQWDKCREIVGDMKNWNAHQSERLKAELLMEDPWNEREENLWSLPLSFRLNAIRETFEETGILLASDKQESESMGEESKVRNSTVAFLTDEDREKCRLELKNDVNCFAKMCLERRLKPEVNSLYPWARWITPKSLKYRYNTMFFVSFLERIPDHAFHDNGEYCRFEKMVGSVCADVIILLS